MSQMWTWPVKGAAAGSQMRAAGGMTDAEEVGPFVHGQSEKPANLFDERTFSFLLEGRFLALSFL